MLSVSFALLVAGCGSKSALVDHEPMPVDASMDVVHPDAVVDTSVDHPDDAGEPFDVCTELPPEEPPSEVNVAFESRIRAADILFLIDTTGSMSEEIERIRRTVRDTLLPGLVDAIGDVRIGVASFADFPVGVYGSVDDRPFLLLTPTTREIGVVESALDRLPTSAGADGPESQTEALYQAASGEGFDRFVSPAACPAGTTGYPCFRSDGSRIILLFTDAPFHNGPGMSNAYGPDLAPAPHTYAEALNALRAVGARVLGMFSGGSDPEALADLNAIARNTGAVTPSGAPIVFDIGRDGSRLDTGVVESVQTLVEEVPIDIDLVVEDVPDDGFDALEFVRAVETLRSAPSDGAIDRGDRFDRVLPGTRVFFRVLLQNESIPRRSTPQFYFLRIVFRGDGVTRLSTATVKIVIPSEEGMGCEEA
jgi:hypothetical protein